MSLVDWGSGTVSARKSPRTARTTHQAQLLFDGRRLTKTFPTRGMARQWLREQVAAKRAGTLVAPVSMTVKELLEGYRKAKTLRPNSITYQETCTRLLAPLHAVQVQKLRGVQIDAALRALADRGIAASTRQGCRALLSACCKWAGRKGILLRNPVEMSEPVSAEKSNKATWTAQQASAFLEATADHDFAALWHLLLETGLRLNSALGLRWRDVDLVVNRGWITARGQLDQRHGPTTWVPYLKTEDEHRLPIGPRLRSLLLAERDRQQLAAIHKPEGYVFQRHGRHLSESAVRTAFTASVKAAKLPAIPLHGCRHAAGSILLSAGANLKVVQTWLGHATIAITADRYLDVPEHDLEAAADLLNHALGG